MFEIDLEVKQCQGCNKNEQCITVFKRTGTYTTKTLVRLCVDCGLELEGLIKNKLEIYRASKRG